MISIPINNDLYTYSTNDYNSISYTMILFDVTTIWYPLISMIYLFSSTNDLYTLNQWFYVLYQRFSIKLYQRSTYYVYIMVFFTLNNDFTHYQPTISTSTGIQRFLIPSQRFFTTSSVVNNDLSLLTTVFILPTILNLWTTISTISLPMITSVFLPTIYYFLPTIYRC